MQRQRGAPLMQNDVWRARRARVRRGSLHGWLDALRWLQKTTDRGKESLQLREGEKKERMWRGQNFAVGRLGRTADTEGNIALISSLFKQG